MIIRIIGASRGIEIDDPRNFKAFSVRIEGPVGAEVQAELLGRVALSHDLSRPGFPRRRCANGLRSNPRHGGRKVCRT